MTTICLPEIAGLLNKLNNNARVFSRNKVQATKLVTDYVAGNRNLANNVGVARAFYQLIKILDSGDLKESAFQKLETEYPDVFAAEQSKKVKFLRKRSETPDQIELDFCKETLAIYRQMGLISKANYDKFSHSGNVHEIDEFLKTVELKTHKQQLKFAEIFVRNHDNNLGIVPPIILARAHEALKIKVDSGVHGYTEDLLNRILTQIDDWSNQFATYENVNNFIPSSKSQQLFNFVDTTNIAGIYQGYREVFEQRLKWFPQDENGLLANELRRNINNIDRVMAEYDFEWGLDNFASDEKSISRRYEELKEIAVSWNVSDYVKEQSAKYIFLDKNKKALPSSERLNQIIELVRHETVLKNIANPNKAIDAKQLESDFNNAILLKLSDMAKDGGKKIEERAYNRAKLDYVNQTADFAGRLNSKIESTGKDAQTDLLPGLFKPLESIDSRANARFHNSGDDEYQSKVEFFKRIFKTFASSFLTSAAITGIAIGVATVAGISLSAGIAVVGVTSGIALAYFQIKKWQKNQINMGKGYGIKDLVQDKRMLATLGTTGIAAIGMIFGAFGLTTVMAALGYGALGIGATTGSIQMFNDAKAKGLSNAVAASFAIGNVLAAAAGGIIGRGLVRSVANVDAVAANTENKANQSVENQNQTIDAGQPVTDSVAQETQETITESTETPEQTYHEETRISYTQSGLDNAKRIANMLYQDDMNQLQKHVEMVEQYNASHGTNIDPYRAVMLRADAGGHVPSNYEIAIDNNGGTRFTNGNMKIFGATWLKSHPEFSNEDIKALRDVFNGNTANDAGMKVMERMELSEIVSEKNHVGNVQPPVKPVNGVNTYSNGTPAMIKETVLVPDEIVKPAPKPVVEPVVKPIINEPVVAPDVHPIENAHGAMGMFGILAAKQRAKLKKLRERMGSFFDSMFVQKTR